MTKGIQIKQQNDQRPPSQQEQAGLLCGSVLSQETLNTLEELGDIIKRIHKRMISEGYEIRSGKVCKKIYE